MRIFDIIQSDVAFYSQVQQNCQLRVSGIAKLYLFYEKCPFEMQI